MDAPQSSPGEITRLLSRMRRGDRDAEARLMSLVDGELRRRARPAALVHEFYLRLTQEDRIDWQSRAHLYAVASSEMRRILVDHARHRAVDKRDWRAARAWLHNRMNGGKP